MKVAVPFLLVLLCSGCLHIRDLSEPAVAGKTDEKTTFCGIDQSLRDNKAARLLIIHGMGWHESHDYDEEFRESLRVKLRLEPLGCAGPYPIVDSSDPFNVYGGVLRCTYVRSADNARLRIYNLLWSPLTMPYKVGGLAYDYDRPYHQRRVKMNRLLKRDLIDKSFADAVLYAGELRQPMQYSVRQAICAAVTDQIDLSKPCGEGYSTPSSAEAGDITEPDLFVVTHSLGSAMLMETLGTMKTDAELAAASTLIQHVKLVAMMANQLPLIQLARLRRPPDDGALQGPALMERLFGDRVTRIKIAAFTDINDLLSYPIPETWKSSLYPGLSNRFTFVNYPVTNARRATLGMFANPATAHTGYWGNPVVIDAIARGYDCD